jgi:hypothetical protein
MVCWLFVGSAIFSAAFALLGGQELVERWVMSMNLSKTQFLVLSQVIIFVLGWPLEWTEIIVIFMPIFIPLLDNFGVDPLFFGLLVALNLQTAFLSPPVAMAAFYLKGVSPPHVTLNQIFAGMLPFMGIQVVAIVLLYMFPGIGLWLPQVLYMALGAYLLSFFHRVAPAAISGDLQSAFEIGGAQLGTLAATYFYVYTLMQIPTGVLADTLGRARSSRSGRPHRRFGSLLFGLAPSFELAFAGRTLVGFGVSVAFIAMLKLIAVWYEENRFATLVGAMMFLGNVGTMTAGTPLAWGAQAAGWRAVFVAIGVLSLLIGAAAWFLVQDRPGEKGAPQGRRAIRPHRLAGRPAGRHEEPPHLAGLLRQSRHRRQLLRLRRPVGGALPHAGARPDAGGGPRTTSACTSAASPSAAMLSGRSPTA